MPALRRVVSCSGLTQCMKRIAPACFQAFFLRGLTLGSEGSILSKGMLPQRTEVREANKQTKKSARTPSSTSFRPCLRYAGHQIPHAH